MVDESLWSTTVPVQMERDGEERRGETEGNSERTGEFSDAGVFIAGKGESHRHTHTYTHWRLS